MNKIVTFFFLVILLLVIKEIEAQEVYNLWEGQNKSYYKDNTLKEYEKESWGVMCVFNITEPTLTVYKAEGTDLWVPLFVRWLKSMQ